MKNVSIAEAKVRLSELIEQLAVDGEVVITRRGAAVARLVTVTRARLSHHAIAAPTPEVDDTMPAALEP